MADALHAKAWLTRGCVKEAFDTMPAAICFFFPSGRVKLCNLQMHRLYRMLTQRDLQMLPELHEALKTCAKQDGAVYLFPDGKAWQYSERSVTVSGGSVFTEASLTEVTQLHEKRLELEQQTRMLREVAHKLKALSANVQMMTREKEILAFKTRLHDEMGAGLLAARQSLLGNQNEPDTDAALRLWRKAVRFIRYDNEQPETGNALDEFFRDAAAIGVKVTLNGSLPEDNKLTEVFLIAMRECFTNCVRHAGATEMHIRAQAGNGVACVCITNNGELPKGAIHPGGGLGNLLRHAADCGGSVKIESSPAFKLTVRLPLREEVLA